MTKILILNLIMSIYGYQNTDSLSAYLNDLHQKGNLNGNVLVIKDGKTLYENSFGYTDGSKSIVLTKDYRFNIGSVYKEFPAVSIMQLVENNQLNLDDKVSKYISHMPTWAEKVSIQNLLQYSSGLPKIPWNTYFSNGIDVTEDVIINDLKAIKELEFEPGSDYLYSNSNPILLIKIVENITKTSFNSYLKKHIFNKYAMQNIILKDQYPYNDKTLMAIPFNKDFNDDDAYKLSVQSLLLSATARDMATWFQQLEDYKIVTKNSLKILSKTAKEGDNIQSPLGYTKWETDDIIEHSHHGASANHECIVRNFKKDGITIVILTNQKHGNVSEIADKIYDIIKF